MIGHKLFSAKCLTLFAFIVAVPTISAAQSNSDVGNRISRLEREISDLQRHVFKDGERTRPSITSTPVQDTPLSSGDGDEETTSMAARTEIRLQQLEAQIRNVTGKMENVDFKLDQLNSRIDSLVSDLDKRFDAFEARLAQPEMAVSKNPQSRNEVARGAEPGSEQDDPEKGVKLGVLGYLSQSDLSGEEVDKRGKVRSTVDPILPEGEPAVRYKHAFSYLMRHDYELAERAFREFTKVHGDNPLAGNAMYWLGETHYVREQFAEAAVTFAEGYEKYPDSPKTADNLLKLGLSLARLQRIADACVALAQLGDEFPNASLNIKRRAIGEGKRIGCKG